MVRRCLFPMLCVLLLVLAWSQHSQAGAFFRVLREAQVAPLLCAALLQMGTLVNQPALFQALYALVGIETRWRDLAVVVLAGRFINVVAPAAGLGETALLFEEAKRRGWEMGKVSLATTLYFAFNFAVFALILMLGLVLLGMHGSLKDSEMLATVPLFGGLTVGLVLLLWVAKKPDSFASWVVALVSRVPLRWRKKFLSLEALHETALSFATSLRTLRRARLHLIRPTLHAILVDALEIAVLAACLRAFGVVVTPVLLISSYAVGTLFTIVSVSPQGLGAVEGALGATLVSLGVALPHATAVVLAYRGLSFGLPLAVGFVATRFWSKGLQTAPRPGKGASLPCISAVVPR
jgi:uncharacterized protein (TIRG00374 family)